MKSHVFSFALLSAIAIVSSAPAQAQNGTLTRSFVSSSGSDVNSCMITAPCATFAGAYTKVGANGIIAALDPGKYGPLTITGPVTVNGNGWAAITAPATSIGITINAGPSDNVILKGLEIDGAGAAYDGIVFNTGASLTVTNCSLQNFVFNNGDLTTGIGLLMQPNSGVFAFTITDTIASNNGWAGISYYPAGGAPTANVIIDHAVATANQHNGIYLNVASTTGGATVAAVSNNIASGNGNGVSITAIEGSGAFTVSIDNLNASGNSGSGVVAFGNVSVLLGRSVITGNGLGVTNQTNIFSSSNTFYTYGNNQINLNNPDFFYSTLNTTFTTQ
jgi:hypothetical protein